MRRPNNGAIKSNPTIAEVKRLQWATQLVN